ncbi:MAG: phosphatidylserine decarboxylase family protein [Rhodospirillaceae bacterium]|nr:phosphatidylserine decarboxylase family protein [Rhodospirillaceae bacterium]|tara:strand:- start:2737 stop:3450 length:714 start_codon:yes stop_codon:yes gene_type:complete
MIKQKQNRSLISYFFVPIAREGWPFIGVFAVATCLLFLVWSILGWLGLLCTIWCIYFFRNPDRVTPQRAGLVVAPADGVVQMISEVIPPNHLDIGDDLVVRVSIFMNIFDCHINRIPSDGRIGRLVYIPGRFINASLDKASEENERQMLRIDLDDGRYLGVVQIAGLIARRIVCYVDEEQAVVAGERFGLIRFGSRVDVYLPTGVTPQVIVGQRSISGETVLADMDSEEKARFGEVR